MRSSWLSRSLVSGRTQWSSSDGRQEVDNGGSQGSTNSVAGVLFLLELLVCLVPCLLQRWQLVRGPGIDEVVDGFDVLDQDLVTGVNVSFGMEVVDHT